MTLETEVQQFRGVVCLHCKAPIPVPEIVRTKERILHEDEQSGLSRANSLVFNLRCSRCQKEKPYRTSEIIDFQGVPEQQAPFAAPASARRIQVDERARAAKA